MEEDDADAFATCTARSTAAVKEDFGILRRVKLEDEINLRYVKTSSCYVGYRSMESAKRLFGVKSYYGDVRGQT